MAYIEYEISEASGYAVELFEFSSDAFAIPYTYTSADEDIDFNLNTYTAIYLKRSQPELSKESGAQAITVIVKRDNALAANWRTFVPPRSVFLKIYRYHRSEATPEVVVFWQRES